jgi:hypothetical protein
MIVVYYYIRDYGKRKEHFEKVLKGYSSMKQIGFTIDRWIKTKDWADF